MYFKRIINIKLNTVQSAIPHSQSSNYYLIFYKIIQFIIVYYYNYLNKYILNCNNIIELF